MAIEHFFEFVEVESQPESFDEIDDGLPGHYFLDVFYGEGEFGIGDEDTGAVSLYGDSVFDQLVEDSPDGRGVELELFGEYPDGRQFIARFESFCNDESFDFEDGLPVERFAAVVVEFNFHTRDRFAI